MYIMNRFLPLLVLIAFLSSLVPPITTTPVVHAQTPTTIDVNTNTNDFPADALIYQAPQLLTATGDSENALSMLYVTWDLNYLYIGVDWAPGTWGLALGIAIDANPGDPDQGYGAVWCATHSAWEDEWSRRINQSTPYLAENGISPVYPEYHIYFWYDGTSQSITSAQLNQFKYDQSAPINASGVNHWDPWNYAIQSINYSPVATDHSGSTLFKVAIPWSIINGTSYALTGYNYTGKIAIAVWVAGGDYSSAVSALPLNPETLTAGDEWNDWDSIYMFAIITVDADKDGLPDLGVSPNTRVTFYPSLSTTLTTDSDTYTVLTGGTVTITATLTDQFGNPLPDVPVYVTDGITTLATAYTDASGSATLTFTAPSSPGTYTYTVAFDGHAGWQASNKQITVVVTQPQYKVYGYVTDKDTGTAISGATVELLDPDTLSTIVSNTTGADGYYELTTTAGTYFLRVSNSAAGYANYTKKIVVSGDTRVDVPLEKYLIDLATNANDFPANAFVYTAQTQLTPILEGAKHNLSRIYIAWDTEYLYIGTDFAPEDWWVAYGIAIDVNPGNASTGYGAVWASNNNEWNDCWQRKINQSTPILPDHGIQPIYPELITYFWYQGTDGITAAQINRYKYETYSPIETGIDHWVPWEYGYATPKYSPVATTKDGSTLFKVAIPWSAIQFLPNITYTGEIALVVWVAHGDHSSALSVLPNNPLVFDAYGWDELSDTDVMYMYIKITYDSDKDYVPDDVAPNSVTTFYPTISTTIETDKDVYEVGSGQTVEVKVKVRDAFGNYLAAVRVELYDSNGHFVTANLTTYNTNDPYAFTAVLRFTAPLTKGVYNYTVKFVGEAGFLPSEKNITVNVTRSGTRIVGLTYDLIQDFNGDGLPSAGDVIQIKFKLEGYNNGWQGLPNKPVIISLQYKIHTTYSENISTVTGTDGYVSYDYTIPADMVGADLLTITAIFEGDDDYAPTSASTTAEVNIARVIDGNNNDWGTGLPRSTPGIAPRGDEIVITDPANDIHMGATGVYTELDIKEVRITYDGLYLYFYVKFTGSLTKPDEFTVNVAIDASPDNPADGVSEWLYGYWFTDIRLGGFTGSGKHIDVWRWTHIVEAVPIENKVNVYSLSGSPVSAGKLAVNTAEGFIEFAVPVSSLEGLDPTYGFRVWITVFGVPSTGKYVSLTGANAIDVAGVGNTNLELLTYRDPNWGNLTWPSEDIWVDTAFTIKFKAPSTPDIPDPSPDVPPSTVDLLYIIYNGTLYKPEEFTYNGSARIKVMLMVYVQGTQGRPVNATVDTATYTGVAGADDIALIPVVLPEFTPSVTITTTSDGLSDSVTIQTGFRPPPMPEPLLLPLLVLIAFLLVLLYRKKK